MAESSIEWTEHTWNPVTGCTKVSPGCKHCYAETMARRLQAMGAAGYEQGFRLAMHPQRLQQPLQRKAATTYFVNSMSDLFHEDVPDAAESPRLWGNCHSWRHSIAPCYPEQCARGLRND